MDWIALLLSQYLDCKKNKIGNNSQLIDETPKRKFNVRKQESSIWKKLDNVKGSDRKCSGRGRDKQFYEWDNTHNDIEIYDHKGRHRGSLDPITGVKYKEAVPGRRIKI